jgi:hypothetical protein
MPSSAVCCSLECFLLWLVLGCLLAPCSIGCIHNKCCKQCDHVCLIVQWEVCIHLGRISFATVSEQQSALLLLSVIASSDVPSGHDDLTTAAALTGLK